MDKQNSYRTRKQWSTAVDCDLYEKFKALSKDSRIPATRLLDEAIEDLLFKYKVIDKKTKTP